MTEIVIADTGPLVAYLDKRDHHHGWAQRVMADLDEPLWTCEAVLAEAAFLLRRGGIGSAGLMQLVERKLLRLPLDTENEAAALRKLMQRYDNVPMSLADACVVRLSELREQARVFTTDSDFQIYRRCGRKVIALIIPPQG